jgi:hypothetical protein
MELWTSVTDWLLLDALDRAARRYAGSRDPLVEASNWAALTVGSQATGATLDEIDGMASELTTYCRDRFPSEIIGYAGWLY